jgi:hypothetical protein
MPQSGKMDDSLFGYGFRYTHEARRAHPAANVIPMDALPTQSGARYLSPYLTCLGCDTVAMVNSATIQRALGFIPRGGAIPIEVLPKCSTCGKTSEWRVGAHDFSKEMDCSREDRLLLEKLKVKMAVQIQRMFRGYQGRKFARGEAERERKKKAKQDKSATLIQTQYRLYDAKRIAVVERALAIIKLSHPTLVIQRACQRWKELDGLESGLSHCFWYKTRQQLKLVFLDYRLLVSRSGYQPPQYVVEANIEELARRCKWLRNMFATRVQALQRGGAARLFFSIYRRERVWLREVRCRTAYRVQAVFRGWWGRRLMLRQKRKRWKEGHLGTYKGERKDRAKKERQVTVDSKLQAEYRKSKTEEMTARMVGKVTYEKGSFSRSAYSDSKVELLSYSRMLAAQKAADLANQKEGQQDAKRMYVRRRAEQHPHLKTYLEAERQKGVQLCIDRVTFSLPPQRKAGAFARARRECELQMEPAPHIKDLDQKQVALLLGRDRRMEDLCDRLFGAERTFKAPPETIFGHEVGDRNKVRSKPNLNHFD